MGRCLGGRPDQPLDWVRFTAAGDLPQVGRVQGCRVTGPATSLSLCHGCPAFRGVDREGIMRDIAAPDGTLVAMSLSEHEAWQDDPEAFWEMREQGSPWSLRHSGTLEWDEHWAAWMRSYRARQTDAQRDRQRTATRARVARHRAARCNVNYRGPQKLDKATFHQKAV